MALFTLLGACGGGGSGSSSSTPVSTTPAAPTLVLSGSTNVVSTTTPAVLSAVLKNSSGAEVPGVVVTFATTGTNLGALFPVGGTALTDANGIASITLNPGTASGADSVTAKATVNSVAVTSNAFGYASTGTTSAAVVTLSSSSSSISSSSPAILSATVHNSSGALVAGTLVRFATAGTGFALFSPSGATALTNASGVAQISLLAGSQFGADTVTATATVSGVSVSSSALGFSVSGTASASQITLAASTNTISSSTPTTLTATLSNTSGTPLANTVVTFATQGTGYGVFFPSGGTALTNSSGVATITLNAGTQIGADTVTATATVSGVTVTSSPLGYSVSAAPVTSTAASIQFVSANPTIIALRGIGGQENSTIVFKVRDSNGNPLANQAVTFALTTTAGAIGFASTSPTSASDGTVNAVLQAGTVPTAVRVKAVLTSNTNITSVSSQLVVSTGLPHQNGFSLAASKLNLEAFNFDGITSQLTVRLADRYGNLVPDGTAVSFRTAGGVGLVVPSCTTTAGACTVQFTSAGVRPINGRLVILATAIGEESFIDLNGNGLFDASEQSTITDLGEAYIDANENGVRDAGEEFIDFNNNQRYDGPTGNFVGILRNDGVAPSTLNVRASITLVLSTSAARIAGLPAAINPAQCTNGTPFTPTPQTFTFTIGDLNGNRMVSGTTIVFSTSNGTITSQPASFTALDSNVNAPQSFTVSLASDATQDATALACTNATHLGSFLVTVTSPTGAITTASIPVND